uniref:Uncharacterized protein n=1 Tax=Bionectria ochroleuca TaxID=29856 RepID=A0A0B7KIW8_BIOOC
MAIFGVKRSTEIQAAAEEKGIDTIGVFPVRSHTEDEIIIGEIDSHLDFQTSILIRPEDRHDGIEHAQNVTKGEELVVTTVVHCHGLFGKIYIMIIRAFHVMISGESTKQDATDNQQTKQVETSFTRNMSS